MRAFEIITEKPVESTWITDLTYNRPNRVSTMRISNGRSFSISGITRNMFERWNKAESKGQFYHQHIKDVYNIKRIK